MKPALSISTWTLLAACLLLPAGVGAVRPRPALPLLPPERPAAAIDAERNASRLVDAIIQIESNGDPRKIGRHGERGLMQIKAGTWRDMTIRLLGAPLPFDQAFDPALNRRVGTAYLAFLQEQLLPRQREWRADERALLLAAYNAGPGRLARSRFDLAHMPLPTQDYVERASALHDAYLDAPLPLLAARPNADAGI